jgi:hypothetical protein
MFVCKASKMQDKKERRQVEVERAMRACAGTTLVASASSAIHHLISEHFAESYLHSLRVKNDCFHLNFISLAFPRLHSLSSVRPLSSA